jgi:hypothetical protein
MLLLSSSRVHSEGVVWFYIDKSTNKLVGKKREEGVGEKEEVIDFLH